MKNLKTSLKILMTAVAWLGMFWFMVGIFALGSHVYYSIRFPIIYTPGLIIDGPAFDWVILSGAILALIGGLIARPRFLWPVLVISGATCSIFALIGIIPEHLLPGGISISITRWALGLFCIIGGVIIRWLRRSQNIKTNTQVSEYK
jgi:hypothetical protein